MENLLLDTRYALRVLRKSPGFTLVAVLTLMLGIGANIVVFGVLNAILLQPLAVNDPQNLYQLRHQQWMSFRLLTTSYPAFQDLQQRNTTFSGMAGVNGYSHATLRWRHVVKSIRGNQVTGNYFDLLGVRPGLGRFFHAADEHGPGSAPYIVLSNELWRSTFAADQGIVGTTVTLNKHPFTVVGITPAEFHGTERFVWPDYWMPMMNEQQVTDGDYLDSRTSIAVTVLGRLRPGVMAKQATDNLNAIAVQLSREHPQTDEAQPLRLIHPGLFGDQGDVIRGFLYSVTLLALLVLAAACANLASLFASRAADRSAELALRVALGSSRQRLLRQLLTEAVLLSITGGAAGLVSAQYILGVLNRWQSPYGHLAVSVDARVYLVGLAFTLASVLLSGVVPAWQAWQSSPLQMMKEGPGTAFEQRRFALRDLLLGVQITICTLLVVASLVAVRGMQHALDTPLGFQPQHAMLVDLDFSEQDQVHDAAWDEEKTIIEAAQSLPGVTAAGAVNRTPMTGGLHGVPVFRPGVIEFKVQNAALAPYVFSMSPGYLQAAGIRLLAGRDVSWRDTAKTPAIALVNETLARQMWGSLPAIGQRFIVAGKLTEVVGLTQDGKYHDLQETPQPITYLPYRQQEPDGAVYVVRSQRPLREAMPLLLRTLSSLEPNVPINVQSWTDTLDGQRFPAQAATMALGVMGLLAALLAVTGIAGMAAYSVSRRKKEIGIRVALGARKSQVLSAAVGRPMVLLAAGSVLGLLGGLAASRLLNQIVYQANPLDPVVIGGAVVTMALLGLAASAMPAYRALSIDPARLMRDQ